MNKVDFQRPQIELIDRGRRLRVLMKYLRITSQQKLADMVDCSQPLIGRLLKGDPQYSSSDIIRRISISAPCDYDWLEYGMGPSPGSTIASISKWEDLKSIEKYSIKKPFILPIIGQSMEDPSCPSRSFFENQIIKIDPRLSPSNGDFVIALLKNEHIVLRKYVEDAGDKKLMTFTQKEIPYDQVAEIYGVVTEKTEILKDPNK